MQYIIKILKGSLIGLLGLVFLWILFIIWLITPGLSYAKKTTYQDYLIYHDQPLDSAWYPVLEESMDYIQTSELYSPDQKFTLCLNDGSFYPGVIEKLAGQAFGYGGGNLIILFGEHKPASDQTLLNGKSRNLSGLITHEAVHVMQFRHDGFMKSIPGYGPYPAWKREGYAEWVAMRNSKIPQHTYREMLRNQSSFWINFSPTDGTVRPYLENALIVAYLMEQKEMNYASLMLDPTPRDELYNLVLKP